MGTSFWFDWEIDLMVFLQSKVTPFIQKLCEIITFFGDEYAMILIIGFLYWGYKKELGKKLGIYAVTALMISVDIKDVIKRRRPYFDHPAIRCIKPRSNEGGIYDIAVQGYSFPSAHAVNSVTTYSALGMDVKNKILKIFLIVCPLIIGLSRVTLGVHYPTDVIAGWLISIIAITLISLIQNQYIIYGLIIAMGIAGCFISRSTDFYSSFGISIGFIAGFLFEERFVKFENTKNVFRMILRTALGIGIFLVLNTLFKLPFSEAFLESVSSLAFAVRTARYAIIVFLLIGVYPMAFKFVDKKILKK